MDIFRKYKSLNEALEDLASQPVQGFETVNFKEVGDESEFPADRRDGHDGNEPYENTEDSVTTIYDSADGKIAVGIDAISNVEGASVHFTIYSLRKSLQDRLNEV